MINRILSAFNRKTMAPPAANQQPSAPIEIAEPTRRKLHPAISIYAEGQAPRRLCVKKYGAGKSYAWMSGPDEYLDIAGECLLRSFTTVSYVLEDLFRQRMRRRGVPEEVIHEFLRSAMVDDEAFLTDSE